MMQMTKTMDGFVKEPYEKILKIFPTGIRGFSQTLFNIFNKNCDYFSQFIVNKIIAKITGLIWKTFKTSKRPNTFYLVELSQACPGRA